MIRMLILSLTGACNLACRYCYAAGHPPGMLQTAEALAAVDLAAAGGQPLVIQFSGGEPLLNVPVMQAVIEYVHKRRLPVRFQLQTNATLLTPAVAAILKKAQVGVGISLDGRPDVNDQLRCYPDGSATANAVVQGVLNLAQAGMAAGITCVVTRQNVLQLSGIVDMAYYLGNIRLIGFDLLRRQGRGTGIAPPEAQEVRQGVWAAYQQAEYLKKCTGRSMQFASLERAKMLTQNCSGGFAHCHAMKGEAVFVDTAGRLYACASLAGMPDFYIGHVTTGIDERRRQAVAKAVIRGMSFCTSCQWFAGCGGSCFARWYGADSPEQGYGPECALKQVSIQWLQEMHSQGSSQADNLPLCRC